MTEKIETSIEVLDHGHVTLIDSLGNDLSIVNAARVSFGEKIEEIRDKDIKLINYLMKHNHTTPFEQVVFTFRVKAPIFVFRQWHRHRTWSFNEMSARYTELPGQFYKPYIDLVGSQSKDDKQARDLDLIGKDTKRVTRELTWYMDACGSAYAIYKDLLLAGWPRELARCVLPVSTYSEMVATVNLHNLFHFLKLRMDEHAQYEIRVYANAMLKLIEEVVPHSVTAWRKKNETV